MSGLRFLKKIYNNLKSMLYGTATTDKLIISALLHVLSYSYAMNIHASILGWKNIIIVV